MKMLRLPEVQQRTGLSRSSIYGGMARSEFPHSIKLGARSVGWLADEIDAFLAERVQARNDAARARGNK